MTSERDSEDLSYEKLSDLLKANNELTKDVCMLKQLVYCLNSQLGRYQKLYFLNQKLQAQNFPSNVIPPLPESSISKDKFESTKNLTKKGYKPSKSERNVPDKSVSFQKDCNEDGKMGNPSPTTTEGEEKVAQKNSEKNSEGTRLPLHWDALTLPPLLDAYEETIKEKDFIIKEYERKMIALGQQCRAVVLENEALHNEREKWLKKGGNHVGTSKSISDRIFFLEEQNKLLKEFLDLEKDKLKEIQDIYEDKISELTTDLSKTKDEYRRCVAELSDAKGRCNFLADEASRLRRIAEDSIPMSVHNKSVEECKRLLEELKVKYERDNQSTLTKLKEIEEAKSKLMVEVAELTDLKNKSERLMKTKEHLLRRSKQKCIQVCVRLTKSERQNELLRDNLRRAVSLLEELSMDSCRNKDDSNQIDESSMQQRILLLRAALQTFQHEARKELDSIERRLQRHKKKKKDSRGVAEQTNEHPTTNTVRLQQPTVSNVRTFEWLRNSGTKF